MKSAKTVETIEEIENRDPITGTPGAHPVGTGLGAAGGGAAGAAVGAIGGPIGAAVGLVAGAVAGGLAGKGVAEGMDPTVEDAYWRENYTSRPYVDRQNSYDMYEGAYRTGYEGRARYSGKTFAEAESDLRLNYETSNGRPPLAWVNAKHAIRDGWNHVEEAIPGDYDGDGR